MPILTDQDTVYAKALLYSMNAHKGQYRDYSKQPYVSHVIRVAEFIHDHFDHRDDYETLRAIALLHDVLEDTWVEELHLKQHFDEAVVGGVRAISHDKSLPKEKRDKQYKKQLVQGPDTARIVKLADIWDNTHDVMDDEDRYHRYLTDSHELLTALNVDDESFRDKKDELKAIMEERKRRLRDT